MSSYLSVNKAVEFNSVQAVTWGWVAPEAVVSPEGDEAAVALAVEGERSEVVTCFTVAVP